MNKFTGFFCGFSSVFFGVLMCFMFIDGAPLIYKILLFLVWFPLLVRVGYLSDWVKKIEKDSVTIKVDHPVKSNTVGPSTGSGQ